MTPRVSVLLPYRDAAGTIEEALGKAQKMAAEAA